MFYRPASLSADPQKAPASLQWQLNHDAGKAMLRLSNPSLYHVTVVDAKVHVGSAEEPIIDAKMVAPNATVAVPIKLPTAGAAAPELRYDVINDYGGRQSYRVILRGSQPSTPVSTGN